MKNVRFFIGSGRLFVLKFKPESLNIIYFVTDWKGRYFIETNPSSLYPDD